jgi:hypothetical protein
VTADYPSHSPPLQKGCLHDPTPKGQAAGDRKDTAAHVSLSSDTIVKQRRTTPSRDPEEPHNASPTTDKAVSILTSSATPQPGHHTARKPNRTRSVPRPETDRHATRPVIQTRPERHQTRPTLASQPTQASNLICGVDTKKRRPRATPPPMPRYRTPQPATSTHTFKNSSRSAARRTPRALAGDQRLERASSGSDPPQEQRRN